jgi:hypothetical protein
MTEQEINQIIATQINGWTHVEGIVYQDSNGNYCYMADYCNSIAHALDLAMAHQIGLMPSGTNWEAYSVSSPTVKNADSVAPKAICLCLLAIHGVSVS